VSYHHSKHMLFKTGRGGERTGELHRRGSQKMKKAGGRKVVDRTPYIGGGGEREGEGIRHVTVTLTPGYIRIRENRT